MARTPVTRVQLDAYRFGQRRLESALARRDPVLQHEEIRGQNRVVLTGVAVALVALLGAVVLAKVWPERNWKDQQIIVGKQSGQMFAVINQASPESRLVPVHNLAAARLVRYAADRDGSSATKPLTEMDDADFADAPRTAPAAVPGAEANLPTEDASAKPAPVAPWAVCDTANGAALVAGSGPVPPLGAEDGVLLKGPERRPYLVVGGRKYRIDSAEVYSAYGLRDTQPRPTSGAVLDAIPDGAALSAPEIPGAGRDSSALPGQAVGDVVRVERAGRPSGFYLVLADGVVEVAEPVAALVRASLGANRGVPAPSVRAEQIDAVDRVAVPALDDYPKSAPRLVGGPAAGAVCWRWAPNGRGGALVVAPALPLVAGRQVTRLAQADGPAGAKLDEVAVPAGSALVACAVTAEADCSQSNRSADQSRATLWLVSETGVGYPIANSETAAALGVRTWSPVPVEALRTLPVGQPLDVAQAQRTIDVLTPTS